MACVDGPVLMGAKPPRSSSFSSSIDWLSLDPGEGSFGAVRSVVGTASDCESAGEGTAVLSSPEEASASTAANKPPLILEEEGMSSEETLVIEALLWEDV